MFISSMFAPMKNNLMIRTERLILLPLDTSYFASTYSYSTDLENTRFMVHMPKANKAEVMEFLSYTEAEWQKVKPAFYEYAVTYEGVHIGAVSVYFNSEFTHGEIGYIIDKHYHGNGFAHESAKAVIDMCVAMGVRSFTAHCDSENFPSIRVLEKLGMHFVSCRSGRKNRSSDEMRNENSYKLNL